FQGVPFDAVMGKNITLSIDDIDGYKSRSIKFDRVDIYDVPIMGRDIEVLRIDFKLDHVDEVQSYYAKFQDEASVKRFVKAYRENKVYGIPAIAKMSVHTALLTVVANFINTEHVFP